MKKLFIIATGLLSIFTYSSSFAFYRKAEVANCSDIGDSYACCQKYGRVDDLWVFEPGRELKTHEQAKVLCESIDEQLSDAGCDDVSPIFNHPPEDTLSPDCTISELSGKNGIFNENRIFNNKNRIFNNKNHIFNKKNRR